MHIAVYNKCMRLFYLQIISKLSGIERFCNEHLPEFVSQSYYHIKLGYYTIGVGFELHSQYNIKKHNVLFASETRVRINGINFTNHLFVYSLHHF